MPHGGREHSAGWLGSSAVWLLALLPVLAAGQCSAQQEFYDANGNFLYNELQSGVPANGTLCPTHWVWYKVRTRRPVTWPRLQQDGSVWSEQPVTEIMPHSLSILADAGYDEISMRFTSLSLLVVNGTPPIDDNRLASSDPYDAARFVEVLNVYKPITDRETVAFGYNDTIGPLCQQPLDDFVYIALRCLQPQAYPRPCAYNLTVTLLPHTLRNGMDFDAYLNPVEQAIDYTTREAEPARHYFRLSVSAFEMMQLSIERRADGQPLSVTTDGLNGQVVAIPGEPQRLFDEGSSASLGVGWAGGVYMKRVGGECPSNFTAEEGLGPGSQACPRSLNDSVACVLGSVCTTEGGGLPPPPPPPHWHERQYEDTLDLVVMIEARVGEERPLTYVEDTADQSQYAPIDPPGQCETLNPLDNDCEFVRNLVDQNGQRREASVLRDPDGFLVGQRPRYNAPVRYMAELPGTWMDVVQNEMRLDRGVYRLRLRQLVYAEGALMQNEGRPGCVAYGQMRRYTILTTNAKDAALSLHALAESASGLAALYVGEGFPPTEQSYTAMAERADPSRLPLRLNLAPCNIRTPTTWHIGVMLEPHALAVSRGVAPTTFTLSVHLESALLLRKGGEVTPRGADNATVPAQGLGGDGYVCCGVIKYFLVPGVPDHLSVHAELTVTRGTARALYLKARECPVFPADVQGDVCLGKCSVHWLTRFNPYDGTAVSTSATTLQVPNGLGADCPTTCPPDLRMGGDWYVGVQALPGESADFRLVTSLVEPPQIDHGHQCDPDEPECRGPVVGSQESSAPRRRSGVGGARGQAEWAAATLLGGVGTIVLGATATRASRSMSVRGPSRRAGQGA